MQEQNSKFYQNAAACACCPVRSQSLGNVNVLHEIESFAVALAIFPFLPVLQSPEGLVNPDKFENESQSECWKQVKMWLSLATSPALTYFLYVHIGMSTLRNSSWGSGQPLLGFLAPYLAGCWAGPLMGSSLGQLYST